MKRLYNEYLAQTPEGQELAQKAHLMLRALTDWCVKQDYDLRDVENVLSGVVDTHMAELILTRAMKMRQKQHATNQD